MKLMLPMMEMIHVNRLLHFIPLFYLLFLDNKYFQCANLLQSKEYNWELILNVTQWIFS